MRAFIKGMDLCAQFFQEVAKPILDRRYPELVYSAGLLGYGSDVLGFDDEVSTDHMWGPRFYLFLREADLPLKEGILEVFSREFPCEYRGYSVNFSKPDPNDGGVRHPEPVSAGPVSPLVFVYTPEGYLNEYLGVPSLDGLTEPDWLAFSEHRLLALTSGRFFADGLRIGEMLQKLRFYPETVKLYLIASNWSLIAEEQAFVKRCSDVGDEVGSILACCRIAERLMRLCFLYCGRYAPYSKWFGKAFGLLPVDDAVKESIRGAVKAGEIGERECCLVRAQKLLADLHNAREITGPVDVKIQNYFGRDIQVIFADKLAEKTAERLAGTALAEAPLIGSMSQVSNFVKLSDDPAYRENIQALYKGPQKP